ncbi:MAG: diphthine--ammonia ligase [Candidatus Micrarchaeota archaeon]
MKRAICLFSGGKDSVFATWWALFQGFDINLLTFQSEEYSMMFHHPNISWTKMQAMAAGLPHFVIRTTKETELNDLEQGISELGADVIITGAIASEYQKQRIEQIGEKLGIATHSPLWHKEKILLNEMLKYFEIYTVAVSAEGLGKKFLTKPFAELVKHLPKNIHPFLEGGEGETFVTNAPFFKQRIIIDEWDIIWDGVRGTAEIKRAHLVHV